MVRGLDHREEDQWDWTGDQGDLEVRGKAGPSQRLTSQDLGELWVCGFSYFFLDQTAMSLHGVIIVYNR